MDAEPRSLLRFHGLRLTNPIDTRSRLPYLTAGVAQSGSLTSAASGMGACGWRMARAKKASAGVSDRPETTSEAGSRHAAWCPDGALILAIFQVPNKFFEADGRVVDAAGQDWDETWGHTGAQRARSA